MEETKNRKVTSFEDLDIWKESMSLSVTIYQSIRNCQDFGFKDQIQRASISIPSNIAEGFDRQTNKEFIQFLYIAKGSCAELRTQLYLGIALKYIETDKGKELLENSKTISKKIYSLIKYRKENNKQ